MYISECLSRYIPGLEYRVLEEKEVVSLGFLNAEADKVCSFAAEKKYVSILSENIKMLITSDEVAKTINLNKTGCIIVDDPKQTFFALHNKMREENQYVRGKKNTYIDPTAQISPQAFIADKNVVIGPHVIIEPFVTVYENSTIDDGCVLRSGCRIGGVGFQENRNGDTIETVEHFGGVHLHAHVEMQNNSCIDRALFPWEDTEVGEYTKIDSLVQIGHAVKIGRASLITANVTFGGRVNAGSNVWFGLNSTIRNGIIIGDNARINMGSVVVYDVKENESVSGNYAIPHQKFLYNQLHMLSGN